MFNCLRADKVCVYNKNDITITKYNNGKYILYEQDALIVANELVITVYDYDKLNMLLDDLCRQFSCKYKFVSVGLQYTDRVCVICIIRIMPYFYKPYNEAFWDNCITLKKNIIASKNDYNNIISIEKSCNI